MKDFLNKFMDARRNPPDHDLEQFTSLFERTSTQVLASLGPRPFHIRAGLNAAVFDSVFTAFSHHLDAIPADVKKRYTKNLLGDREYLDSISSSTTDKEVVDSRLSLAERHLFG